MTSSDESLIERARLGDRRAFAELWRRHYRSGVRVARQFTSSIDADDLVSEAYTRILKRVLAGGGPTGAFRPYLYTTIRNLASSWGSASRELPVDMAEFEDRVDPGDPTALTLDRTLTARAFRSLPKRWQSVLWYTEVEGMDPHEVAPLLGMTANGVAALSYRAREGLRRAWLQAHIRDQGAFGECRWAIARVGYFARNGLTARDSRRMSDHLVSCSRCTLISEEVEDAGSRLALVMLPIILGGVAGTTLLDSMRQTGSANAAEPLVPTPPDAIGGVTAGGGFGAATAPIALLSTVAVVIAVSGSAVTFAPEDPAASQAPMQSQEEPADDEEPFVSPVEPVLGATPDPTGPSSLLGVGLDTVLGPVPSESIVPFVSDAAEAALTVLPDPLNVDVNLIGLLVQLPK